MSAKESRGPSAGTHTKPSGHGRRGLPTGRPSRIVGSSETAVRFARSPVAQLVERLTVNQEVAGSSPARGANILRHFRAGYFDTLRNGARSVPPFWDARLVEQCGRDLRLDRRPPAPREAAL